MIKTFKTINKNKSLKYYLLNKLLQKKTKNLLKIKKTVVGFNQKTTNLKQLAMANLALEIMFFQSSSITTTKKAISLLKVKKHQPTGCKLSFNNPIIIAQIVKTTFNVFKNNKNKIVVKLNKKHLNSVSTSVSEVFNFEKLEKFFLLFNTLERLNISFTISNNLIYNKNSNKEILFLINLFC